MSPFDIINHLCTSNESNWDDVGEKDYNTFMVNRGLSYYTDCVMLSNEMNRNYNLPKKVQYDFYLNAISPKKKRWSKWSSSKKDKELEMISSYYNISLLKAAGVRSLLSVNDIIRMEEIMDKGGQKSNRNK